MLHRLNLPVLMSTGVLRPKMLMSTVTRPFVSSMLATSPSKFSNVPSLIFTPVSGPEADLQLGGLVAFSSCLARMAATRGGASAWDALQPR